MQTGDVAVHSWRFNLYATKPLQSSISLFHFDYFSVFSLLHSISLMESGQVPNLANWVTVDFLFIYLSGRSSWKHWSLSWLMVNMDWRFKWIQANCVLNLCFRWCFDSKHVENMWLQLILVFLMRNKYLTLHRDSVQYLTSTSELSLRKRASMKIMRVWDVVPVLSVQSFYSFLQVFPSVVKKDMQLRWIKDLKLSTFNTRVNIVFYTITAWHCVQEFSFCVQEFSFVQFMLG